ncbi:MAG TPA: hypothetical protein VEJ20_02740 [Candidatus Eremiobacteraceae bacterium]|nr:hypothetical protein [Candidatus Eremiobacteraceae bacterium]
MSDVLLISTRQEVLTKWQNDVGGTPIPHVEALARTFADAHARGARFDEIYADFRDENRALVRALFQTASFNREQVAGTSLKMDVDPGTFAEQQQRFFSGLGMVCSIL